MKEVPEYEKYPVSEAEMGKRYKNCPVVKQWSDEPEICDVLLREFVKGVAHELNPKFKTDGFRNCLFPV